MSSKDNSEGIELLKQFFLKGRKLSGRNCDEICESMNSFPEAKGCIFAEEELK